MPRRQRPARRSTSSQFVSYRGVNRWHGEYFIPIGRFAVIPDRCRGVAIHSGEKNSPVTPGGSWRWVAGRHRTQYWRISGELSAMVSGAGAGKFDGDRFVTTKSGIRARDSEKNTVRAVRSEPRKRWCRHRYRVGSEMCGVPRSSSPGVCAVGCSERPPTTSLAAPWISIRSSCRSRIGCGAGIGRQTVRYEGNPCAASHSPHPCSL